ncbi:methylmalonyl Co-A mutase-associated GTPase MeaB [Arenibacter sp. GZD96]|uniref:methylmalonyl Co-A mutase-associated GTPase MeaB n=1 Tax=Aurantibrevibacter litoralis TaxID=3106030 RepID=UPI002AFFCE31|nr:methylmalonyl Co-A mutase-associated GTPase MeaB [Arenibacter sp. GZD-96]MEA1785035.1 methylmalonyl Co-A mutase-associated GTPase MeaB [Arenibacter sp. GZD-96]
MAIKKNINPDRITKIKSLRKHSPAVSMLLKELLNGNETALSKAITVLESTRKVDIPKAEKIIERCLSQKKDSIRIGITGPPGVGKSTFIESFGKHLLTLGKKVAVLAIDPSSSISKGSILGDKTRMQELVKHPNVFVRPSPSGDTLGGVARKTRETIMLCEAAGYDIILIETVGVGQNEIAANSMVDFFLVLQLPGAGDELQGIKRGMMEMADAIAINKADGEAKKMATIAQRAFSRALHLFPPKENGWVPKVVLCSAQENEGIAAIWDMIKNFETLTKTNGHFEIQRKSQNKFWLLQTIDTEIKNKFYQNTHVQTHLDTVVNAVMNNEISPFAAAKKLLDLASK